MTGERTRLCGIATGMATVEFSKLLPEEAHKRLSGRYNSKTPMKKGTDGGSDNLRVIFGSGRDFCFVFFPLAQSEWSRGSERERVFAVMDACSTSQTGEDSTSVDSREILWMSQSYPIGYGRGLVEGGEFQRIVYSDLFRWTQLELSRRVLSCRVLYRSMGDGVAVCESEERGEDTQKI